MLISTELCRARVVPFPCEDNLCPPTKDSHSFWFCSRRMRSMVLSILALRCSMAARVFCESPASEPWPSKLPSSLWAIAVMVSLPPFSLPEPASTWKKKKNNHHRYMSQSMKPQECCHCNNSHLGQQSPPPPSPHPTMFVGVPVISASTNCKHLTTELRINLSAVSLYY